MNECVLKMCEELKIVKSFTSACNPQCNGAVERLNRTLIAKLAQICNGSWDQWDEKLPWALYSYQTAPIGRLDASPSELLFGRKAKPLSYDKSDHESPKSEINQVEIPEIVQKINSFRDALHQSARQQREEEIEKSGLIKDSENIRAGDVIMKKKKSFEKENKLDEKWCGPFLVVKDFNNGGYEIKSTNGKLYRYNRKDLKRMEGTDPEEWFYINEGRMLPDENELNLFTIRLSSYCEFN